MCVSCDWSEGGTELRWSHGGVILVSNSSNIVKIYSISAYCKAGEAVIMGWDANVSCGEKGIDSAQYLLPSKWNPKVKHAEVI